MRRFRTAVALVVATACGRPAPGPAPAGSSRAAAPGAEQAVTLDRAAQERLGIRIARLEARTYQPEQPAYGAVLPLQGLAELGTTYARARAEARAADVQVTVTRAQLARLRKLEADQNASIRSLQAAQGTFEAATVQVRGAQESLQALEGAMRQQWGGVVTGWLVARSPQYASLLDGRQVLLRVTLPAGVPLAPAPADVRVRSPSSTTSTATLVSAAPDTDPRIQGMSYLYVAPAAGTELLPGMTVIAYVPRGEARSGVVIPGEAVVWWQGKPWAYEQVAPEQFARREVPTATPIGDGYFAAAGFAPGAPVVVQGAQELLSVQVRPAARAEEDED